MQFRKNLLFIVSLAASAFTSQAFAADGTRVEMNVPFTFVAAGRSLPPGAYQISEDGTLLYLRGNHGALILPSVPTSDSAGMKPSLVFRREAGTAYLIGVQMSDGSRSIPFHPQTAVLQAH